MAREGLANENWIDVGAAAELSATPLRRITAGDRELALSFKDGRFGVVSNTCNHVGGPLGDGTLAGDYVNCPWHNWKFHRCTGLGEAGFEEDAVPAFAVKVENGRVLVDMASATRRTRKPHAPHPLARKIERAAGPVRVAGISTSPMDEANPRFSGSDHLLRHALESCAAHGAESKMIRLNALKFRACEGYYSKAAHACTWPCSITQMDESDQMDRVYEALVHWADAIIVASPIRWGAASSLYFKMAERLNCVQNAITIRDQVLIRNKVAGSSSSAARTTSRASPARCWASSPSSASPSHSFPTWPIRAAGRARTWSAMSRSCASPRSWPKAPPCSPSAVSIWRPG
jgi:nitrite reductase/ring-hydroxylating ferredoxin subunit/multimeric flavodoxin WrbA